MAAIIKLSQNRNYCSSSCLLLPRSSKFTDLQFIFLYKHDFHASYYEFPSLNTPYITK